MNTNRKHIIPTPLYEKREDKKIKIGRICLADFKLVFESEGLVYSSANANPAPLHEVLGTGGSFD